MNVITSMAFSKRFNNWLRPELAPAGSETLADDIRYFFYFLRPSNPLLSLRFLTKLPGSSFVDFKENMKRLRSFLEGVLKAREASSGSSGGDLDFVDLMLQARRDDAEIKDIDDRELVFMMLDFLIAGTDTTSSSVTLLLRHLANDQTLQNRLHDEIKTQVGLDRPLAISDLDKLPFLSACINEQLRLWAVAPSTLIHHVTDDFTLDKYKIKAGVRLPCVRFAATCRN
jgi:cytochrome P450